MFRRRLAAPLLAAVLAACGSEPTDPDDTLPEATFEATVEGAWADTLSGQAHSWPGENTDELKVWTVDLDDTAGDTELFLVTRGVRIPPSGSVFTVRSADGIVPKEQDGARIVLTRRVDGAFRQYAAHAGSILIVERPESRARARGRFEGVLTDGAGDTLRVRGRFHSAEDLDGIDDIKAGG